MSILGLNLGSGTQQSDLPPAYGVTVVDMGDTRGQSLSGYPLETEVGFVQVTYRDASGAPVNNVRASVSFGYVVDDRIPLDYNGRIAVGRTSRITRLFFDNIPNTFIYVVFSPDPNMLSIDTPNPLQSFTSTVGTAADASAATVGVAASLISASSSLTVSRVIYNNGTVPIFIGGANTVTTANGMPIPAGGYFTLDKSYGDIWAISGTAGQDVRIIRERT